MDTLEKHPAVVLYGKMKDHFDPEPIIRFAVRDGYVPDEETARKGMDGVLQWLAGHAVKQHQLPYVMMNGTVDSMLHAFMLNSRLFLHFCRDYVGFFVHHTPLDDDGAEEPQILAGIDYTLAFLRDAFGDNLAPALQEWHKMHKDGELNATSVSCVGNGYDDVHADLLDLTDFQTFWDHESGHVGRA